MEQYKYVYMIKCTVNNKVYIGQTKNLESRIKNHKNRLSRDRHESEELQNDYNKYGSRCFKYRLLERCNWKDALIRETYWIDYYGGINSNNTYNRMNHLYKSDKSKQLISKNHVKTLTEQHKKRISESAKNNPNYGMKNKHLSVETRKLLSEYAQNRKVSKEICEKISKANKVYSDCFIDKLRKEHALLGSYRAVAKKFHMNPYSVSRLIQYGTTNCDKIYKKV